MKPHSQLLFHEKSTHNTKYVYLSFGKKCYLTSKFIPATCQIRYEMLLNFRIYSSYMSDKIRNII